MKVSEFLRRWQISGEVPDEGGAEVAFWAGWLLNANSRLLIQTPDQARDMAIKAAEFIESQ
jgi:hypothetical protein